jgi:hypothetical protein
MDFQPFFVVVSIVGVVLVLWFHCFVHVACDLDVGDDSSSFGSLKNGRREGVY